MRTLLLLLITLTAPCSLVAQTVALDAPLQVPAGQVQAGATDAAVFNFVLTRDSTSPLLPILFTGLSLTQAGTAAPADYTALKLYQFELGTSGVTQTLIATAASPATSFSGFNRLLIPDLQTIFLVTAELPLSAQDGATFIFSASSAQVTVSAGTVTGGPIQGSTHTISNTGSPPQMVVQDVAGTAISSGISSTYDLAAAQGSSDVNGQSYTFTIRNTGSGPLSLTGTPAVAAAPVANCAVNVTQPASTTVAPGGSATFVLEILPSAPGPFTLGVSIFNNSAINPYLFAVSGNAAAIAAVELTITTQPGGARVGKALSPQPVVEARTGAGALDTTYNGLVVATISSGSAGAGLTGVAAVQCVGGVAVFTTLGVDTQGAGYQLTFTSGALATAVSDPFDISGSGSNGGGGGGGGDGGCSGRDQRVWLPLIVIALIGMRLRRFRSA